MKASLSLRPEQLPGFGEAVTRCGTRSVFGSVRSWLVIQCCNSNSYDQAASLRVGGVC